MRIGRADVRTVIRIPLGRCPTGETEGTGELAVAGDNAPPFLAALMGRRAFALQPRRQQVLDERRNHEHCGSNDRHRTDERIEQNERGQKQRHERRIEHDAGRRTGDETVKMFKRPGILAQRLGADAELQAVFENMAAKLVIEPDAGSEQHDIAGDFEQRQRRHGDRAHQREDDERLDAAKRHDRLENLQRIERRRQQQDVDEGGKRERGKACAARILQHPPRRSTVTHFQVRLRKTLAASAGPAAR